MAWSRSATCSSKDEVLESREQRATTPAIQRVRERSVPNRRMSVLDASFPARGIGRCLLVQMRIPPWSRCPVLTQMSVGGWIAAKVASDIASSEGRSSGRALTGAPRRAQTCQASQSGAPACRLRLARRARASVRRSAGEGKVKLMSTKQSVARSWPLQPSCCDCRSISTAMALPENPAGGGKRRRTDDRDEHAQLF